MCGDAAIAITELLTENQALRNAANGFKKQVETAEAKAEKAEREINKLAEEFHGDCYYCANKKGKEKCKKCKYYILSDKEDGDNWKWDSCNL